MSVNHTSSSILARVRRWIWNLLHHGSFGLALLVGVLLLFFKVAMVPYVIRPLIDKSITETSVSLEQTLNQDVSISYSDLSVSLGFNGLYATISQPHLQIGEQRIEASEVELAIYLDNLPAIHITGANLHVTQQESGNWTLGELRLPNLDDGSVTSLGLTNFPVNIIAHDTKFSFTMTSGKSFEINGMNVSFHPNPESERLEISFSVNTLGRRSLTGNIYFNPSNKQTNGYLSINEEHLFLAQLDLGISEAEAQLEVWANYDGELLDGQALFRARDMIIPLNFPGITDDITSSHQARLGSVTVAATLSQPVVPDLASPLIMDWNIAIANAVFDVGEPFLGTPLSLTATQATGRLRKDAESWEISSDEVRLTGSPGSGSFAFSVSQSGTAPPQVDVIGSLPVVDYPRLVSLLPLALSEPGITFLRDDLQITRAQATTLVLQGSDFSTFPWPGKVGGNFLLGMDFFDASLDYDPRYPKLVGGNGSFALEGAALAVTLVDATLGPAEISLAHAGIDDMTAALITLHVAARASLPEGALVNLLHTLPDTKVAVSQQLDSIRLTGDQALDLAITVPLETDDPVVVSGTLEAGTNNALAYTPLQLTLSELTGNFNFSNDGVHGISYGNLLGSSIRLSMAFANDQPHLLIDGTFDLDATLATLGLSNDFHLQGRSAVAFELKDQDMFLRTDMVGTKISLPPPFGKEANIKRVLTASSAKQRFTIDYGAGLARAVFATDGRMALSFNGDQFPELAPDPGSLIYGTLPGIDLDSLLSGDSDLELPVDLPIKLDLQMPGARLLGVIQPQLDLQATLAATVTVASLAGPAINGVITLGEAGKLDIRMRHVNFPESEGIEPEAQTIFVAPPKLSPSLPPLALVVDELRLGEHTYRNLTATGAPVGDNWVLRDFTAEVDGNSRIQANGSTRIKGEPHTKINLALTIGDLGEFLGNYTQGNSILGGTATVTGTLAWDGSLTEPHYLSMQGTLDLQASSFVLNENSSGVKLINLLSPFTVLQNLSSLPESGFNFEQANGLFLFEEGLLHINDFTLKGKDIDIEIAGNTNLITERNNINSIIRLNNSKRAATTAVTVLNPALGALLLFADKVLKVPVIGPVKINYTITGTWDNPEVQHEEAQAEHEPAADN